MTRVIPDIGLGHTSGELEVVQLLPDHFNPAGKRYQRVEVACSCGKHFAIHAVRVRRGKATRCPSCVRAPQRKYHVGDTFDRLTITAFEYEEGTQRRLAVCQCLCGNTTKVVIGLFNRNKSFNCGCAPLPTFQGVGDLSGAFFYKLQRNALDRDFTVEVTKDDLWDLFLQQNRKCALTGIPLTLSIRGKTTASVDRIDSNQGYVIDNIQWVHKDVNRMKQHFTMGRFLLLCRRVTEHQDGTPPTEPMPSSPKPTKRKKPGRKTNGA